MSKAVLAAVFVILATRFAVPHPGALSTLFPYILAGKANALLETLTILNVAEFIVEPCGIFIF